MYKILDRNGLHSHCLRFSEWEKVGRSWVLILVHTNNNDWIKKATTDPDRLCVTAFSREEPSMNRGSTNHRNIALN